MIVNSAKDAQIALIMVSRSVAQIRELRHDLQASTYVYLVLEFFDTLSLRRQFAESVWTLARNLPIVIVMNFEFVGSDCQRFLSDAQKAAGEAALACVVTHVPSDEALRNELRRRGAQLFDQEDEVLMACIGVH
jgi:hypothetical protein